MFTNSLAELLCHEHVHSRQAREMGPFSEIPLKNMHTKHTEKSLLAKNEGSSYIYPTEIIIGDFTFIL